MCKLAWYIVNFVHNTIKGQESGMYKCKRSNLNNSSITVFLRGATIDYLNSC